MRASPFCAISVASACSKSLLSAQSVAQYNGDWVCVSVFFALYLSLNLRQRVPRVAGAVRGRFWMTLATGWQCGLAHASRRLCAVDIACAQAEGKSEEKQEDRKVGVNRLSLPASPFLFPFGPFPFLIVACGCWISIWFSKRPGYINTQRRQHPPPLLSLARSPFRASRCQLCSGIVHCPCALHSQCRLQCCCVAAAGSSCPSSLRPRPP